MQLRRSTSDMNAGGPVLPARPVLAVAVATLILAGCSSGGNDRNTSGDESVKEDIEAVLERRTPELMRRAGVQGVGQALCDGRPCIRVYLLDASVAASLPDSLDGYPVSTVVTGPIRTTTLD
ncbi:MAG TPA: hypothetical protein VK912_15290 [Longimicrobiales bacterium]|nr:hypothetical protein [Longimicrobiales bacterium]